VRLTLPLPQDLEALRDARLNVLQHMRETGSDDERQALAYVDACIGRAIQRREGESATTAAAAEEEVEEAPVDAFEDGAELVPAQGDPVSPNSPASSDQQQQHQQHQQHQHQSHGSPEILDVTDDSRTTDVESEDLPDPQTPSEEGPSIIDITNSTPRTAATPPRSPLCYSGAAALSAELRESVDSGVRPAHSSPTDGAVAWIGSDEVAAAARPGDDGAGEDDDCLLDLTQLETVEPSRTPDELTQPAQHAATRQPAPPRRPAARNVRAAPETSGRRRGTRELWRSE
jgi:hypothetical protein